MIKRIHHISSEHNEFIVSHCGIGWNKNKMYVMADKDWRKVSCKICLRYKLREKEHE